MGLVEELAAYVDAQTSLTLGNNLFRNRLPDSPNTAAVLYEEVGQEPIRVFNNTVYESPRFQLQVRSTSAPVAKALAMTVWTLLENICNSTALGSGSYYPRIKALHSPYLYAVDDKERSYYAANFTAHREV